MVDDPQTIKERMGEDRRYINIYIVFILITTFMIILTQTTIADKDKDNFYKNYVPTNFYITNSTIIPYQCSITRNCQCTEQASENPECGLLNTQMINGVCDNGYRCCHTGCELCHNGDSYVDCNCICTQSVNNEKCESYVSNCYNASVTIGYIVNGVHTSEIKVKDCGIDNIACAENYLDGFPSEPQIRGYYKLDNSKEIILTTDLGFTQSVGILVITIIFSILLGVFMCCCILGISSLEDNKFELERTKNHLQQEAQTRKHAQSVARVQLQKQARIRALAQAKIQRQEQERAQERAQDTSVSQDKTVVPTMPSAPVEPTVPSAPVGIEVIVVSPPNYKDNNDTDPV